MSQSIPDMFSYITIRKENFGGFLFNPYLFNEVTLNQKEMRIAELCNGEYTIEEINSDIAQKFRIDQNQAKKNVRAALNRFNQYYAINWKNKKKKHNTGIAKEKIEAITNANHQLGSNRDFYSAPLSVIFELTYKCNLACQHCLVDAGSPDSDELSFDEIAKILVQLKEMKVFTINFGGGEPLLRPDFFEIMKYASDLNLGVFFSTNGYLINDSVLEKLADLKTFSLQISLDGLESTHDDFRGIQGSYKKAIWALQEFSDKGYHTTMSTMMLKTNLNELESLIKLCVSLGVSSFKLSTFMPAGRGSRNLDQYLLNSSELKMVAEQMLNQKKKYDGKLYIDNKATFPWLLEKKAALSNTNVRNIHIGCSAARSNIVISPNGEVYPCPFLHELSAGNLREKTLRDIWENSEAFFVFRQLNTNQLKGKCRSCEFIPYQCQGGCRAAAFLRTGDFYAEDPYCWHKATCS
jgi:mycofactocin biosynthetic radical S-adenosylmethionine protein MftC